MSSHDLRIDLDYLDEPFGSVFAPNITVAPFADGVFDYSGAAEPLDTFAIHPGAHVLHYSSSIFEGMKAHKLVDGSVAIFRLDDHVRRLQNSADQLCLPVPDFDLIRTMIIDATTANIDLCPDSPGSMYIRPVLFGTFANVGAAATPSPTGLLYVLNCPVGDYFAGGIRPLTVVVETESPRTTPQFGMVKSGANYAMALKTTLEAKEKHGADQILFASGGVISETGASNFFLVNDERVITPALTSEFLHGVTRASLVTLAADLGYEVEERSVSVDELRQWASTGEAFLSGTGAGIVPVGTTIIDGERVQLGDGQPGANTLKLRKVLSDLHTGTSEDTYGWRTPLS